VSHSRSEYWLKVTSIAVTSLRGGRPSRNPR
jgi:hypothetical protein